MCPLRFHQDFQRTLADIERGTAGWGDLAKYLVLIGYNSASEASRAGVRMHFVALHRNSLGQQLRTTSHVLGAAMPSDSSRPGGVPNERFVASLKCMGRSGLVVTRG